MGFLAVDHWFGPQALHAEAMSRPSDWDDRWYQGVRWQSSAGPFVNPDVALTLSAFWQGHRILTENVASFPCHVFERLSNGGRKVATNHPVDDLIYRAPNPSSTAFEYWETSMSHLVLRGNAYADITPGPRGFVDRLDLIHPDLVKVSRLPNKERQYRITRANGQKERKGAEDIFHILGLSFDGLTGVSVIAYALHSLGTILAAERYAGRFFKTGASPSMAVIHPETLGPPGLKNLRDSISAYANGLENSLGILALDEKVDVKVLGIKPEEAQLLATRQYSLQQIAQWLNIPPSLLGDPSTSTYAATRQFRQNLVDLTFRPWVERIEAKIDAELFLAPQKYFSKFNMGALMRGDPAEQAGVQHINVMDGVWTRNEARELQDKNPLPGLDEPLSPLNMGPGGGRQAFSRAQLVTLQAATALVRKEVTAATKAAKQFASDAEGWQGWLRTFYSDHAGDVAQRLRLPMPLAREYAAKQGQALSDGGLDVAVDWEWVVAPALCNLALCADVNGRAVALEGEAA